jgi:uncharacterized protein (TIGR02996 family)
MTDRSTFLTAIHNDPEDLALRLVFADWLEEHGDPLAEYIRVQCELEPIAHDYDDPRAQQLRRREEELLRQHVKEWLGEAALLQELDWPYCRAFTFWRGLPDEVALPVGAFVEHGALLRCCPNVRKAVAFEVKGNGRRLAKCEVLDRFRVLEVADWINPGDARSLAESPHLKDLEALTVWLGNRSQKQVCQAFAAGLPGLRRMELVQHQSGRNARGDALAALVNEIRRTTIAEVRRPFDRLFPFSAHVYTGLFAGRLPGNEQALARCYGKTMMLVVFDSSGRRTRQETCTLEEAFPGESEEEWQHVDDEKVMAFLGRKFGFQPGWIHIQECHVARDAGGYLSVYLHDSSEGQFIDNPDVLPRHATDQDRREVGAKIHTWLQQGDFVVCLGWDELWAGPRGYIHST